ncbi:MAG: DUF2934 domain-containing protein [Opitutales bacterium]|jgi:hypothetical protein
MKNQHFYQDHNQRPAGAARVASSGELNQNKTNFQPAPSAEEVATRAYFSYVNHGSLPGHDVRHWLEAEAELLEERKQTRTHGYPHHR